MRTSQYRAIARLRALIGTSTLPKETPMTTDEQRRPQDAVAEYWDASATLGVPIPRCPLSIRPSPASSPGAHPDDGRAPDLDFVTRLEQQIMGKQCDHGVRFGACHRPI